jgi:hypothetical protein
MSCTPCLSNPVFIHSHCQTVDDFLLMAKSLLSSCPRALRPKAPISSRQSWLALQVHASYLENPIVPCRTHRTQSLTSRVSVWAMSLLGIGLLCIGSIRTLFLRPFISFFAFDILLSTSTFPLLPRPNCHQNYWNPSLTLADHAPAVDFLDTIQ